MPEKSADHGVMNEEAVRGLAQTMQIELTDEEAAALAADLSATIAYAERVEGFANQEVTPMSHPIKDLNVMRPDEVKEVLSLGEALENAPEVTDGMFRVTSIMGGEQ